MLQNYEDSIFEAKIASKKFCFVLEFEITEKGMKV